jgi:hypothetical protein
MDANTFGRYQFFDPSIPQFLNPSIHQFLNSSTPDRRCDKEMHEKPFPPYEELVILAKLISIHGCPFVRALLGSRFLEWIGTLS